MEADLEGAQRKVMSASVRPARLAHGADGIALRDGATLPFLVRRAWSAPAGHYLEAWYLVEPSTREVIYDSPARMVLVWGLQSLTEVEDRVTTPLSLPPGSYQIVFALGGIRGGELDVQAREVSAEEVA